MHSIPYRDPYTTLMCCLLSGTVHATKVPAQIKSFFICLGSVPEICLSVSLARAGTPSEQNLIVQLLVLPAQIFRQSIVIRCDPRSFQTFAIRYTCGWLEYSVVIRYQSPILKDPGISCMVNRSGAQKSPWNSQSQRLSDVK